MSSAFRQFVSEVRVACERFLASEIDGDTRYAVGGGRSAPDDLIAKKPAKKSVKGNPICKCRHNYSVHDEPRDIDKIPQNICRGCEAEGSKIGCPEFVSKRGNVASDYARADDEARKTANGAGDSRTDANGFTTCHRAILAALADKPNKTAQQVAILALYVQSGTFNSAIADLRDMDLINGSPLLRLTKAGEVVAVGVGSKYDAKTLRAGWSAKLGTLGARIIAVLHERKTVTTSSSLAMLAQYIQSGTFNSMIAKMRRMGLITKKLPLRLCQELSS